MRVSSSNYDFFTVNYDFFTVNYDILLEVIKLP
jgi:hypothetical protein